MSYYSLEIEGLVRRKQELEAEIERQKASADYWAGEARRAADGMTELRAEIERLTADLALAEKERDSALHWLNTYGPSNS